MQRDLTELTKQIETFIEQNEEAMWQDLANLVAVHSVRGEAAPGAPYGATVKQALDEALAIARRMGLATNDGEGYLGWAEIPGGEKGYIATITHLDVVPEGEGWSGDPFTLRHEQGWLLGRGVIDDKGPSVLCLYAAKFIKELGEPLRYGLRVLLGCDEESGMQDVEYYLEHNDEPLFCFSPDAEFPLCNGEKGVYSGNFTSAKLAGNLLAFDAGVASNVVPQRAACVVKADAAALPAKENITVTAEEGGARIEAQGVGGHAAFPERTVNAIGLVVEYLLENGLCSEEENRFLGLLMRLFAATDGSGLGIACEDGLFDPLTCIGGVISLKDGVLAQNINIRYPTSTTGEKLTETLQAEAAKAGATFACESDAKPFYIPADSAPIQTLLDTYNEVSGEAGKPFTMGGGTYARHFKNAVSYGPNAPGGELPEFAGAEHAGNEGLSKKDLLAALKIYIVALCRLQELNY